MVAIAGMEVIIAAIRDHFKKRSSLTFGLSRRRVAYQGGHIEAHKRQHTS